MTDQRYCSRKSCWVPTVRPGLCDFCERNRTWLAAVITLAVSVFAAVWFTLHRTPQPLPVSEPLPVAEPIIVRQSPLSLLTMSDQRDTLIARWSRGQTKVPLWLALSISHAEVWNGDSTAVNKRTGALGLFQIHPINFGAYPHCGQPIVNRRVNICYGFEILIGCIEAKDSAGELINQSLAAMLACYGGATRASTRRKYVDAVASRVRVEWLSQ